TSIDETSVNGLSIESKDLAKTLSPIAYACFDMAFGNILNVKECPILLDVEDCYMGSNYIHSKRCAYCYWPRDSEHIFGGSVTWGSSFCINTYYSKALSRAFEVDNCDSCNDIYYSHNCENVRDSMFCFNTKNKLHAIGNSPLPSQSYRELKSSLLEQIVTELERNRDLKWDIFNIGAGHRRKTLNRQTGE
ncbi:MAG: hypothetical protein ABIG39_02820, partial [Candidatus Micrarchaeota archaeon]